MLKKVTREEFLEMMKEGFLKTQHGEKNFTILNAKKKSKHRKHIVEEGAYKKFIYSKKNKLKNRTV